MQEDIYKFTNRSAGKEDVVSQQDRENILHRYRQVDHLCQSIREGNEYAACQIMEERFASGNAGRLQDELTELKYDLVLLLGLMGQTLREIGIENLHLEQVYTDSLRKIEQAGDIEQCRRLSAEIAKSYCRLTRLKSFHKYSPLVREIILSVDMDLGRPLTLRYFAEKLNVNSSYLSGLFKKETGISVTEYVTSRRVEHAANLLLTSQLPIKTIAKQIGIADVHYFSRVFKRKTGQTPSQYRDNRGE